MSKGTILFVDDDRSGRELSRFNLEKAGYAVDEAQSGEEALRLFNPQKHDLIISDIRMEKMSGIDLLTKIKEATSGVPVIMITAYGTVDAAVEAMKLGAFDFILKPFSSDQLIVSVEKALEHKRLKEENRELRLKLSGGGRELVYTSSKMRQLVETVDKLALSDASVFIRGESGTGKELIARRLHLKSKRAEKPFVVVNCAALPAELLESELFGHVKGSFTGANEDRLGRFRHADGGTIFLDEIGEMPLDLQAKLLRVLQEGVVDIVGSDKPVKVDVRVISATNSDIEQKISEGTFRQDLYYRLNVVDLFVPPLRERREDIIPLMEHFLRVFGDGSGYSFSSAFKELLCSYRWPGNVRELQNLCKRLTALNPGVRCFDVEHLPPSLKGRASSSMQGFLEKLPLPPEGISLVDLERELILKALIFHGWNVSKTAKYLSVPRHVLAYRMEKYGITKEGGV
ncbi:MAG: sigma-54-dependent Fis family transcriptional regulator [Candidatus Dadabacteria bacterium]|nr:MAG: sigma-54-dependent Fis family transcriptional regulator [Candidatus Dadabacteria bacterium]